EGLRCLVAPAPELDRLHEQLRLQRLLALETGKDALVYRLVEARHCRHDGRPNLRHVARQRLRTLREVDLRTERQGKGADAGVLVGVRQGEEREEDLVAQAEFHQEIARAEAVRENRAMAERDALGQAAGPR